MKRQKELNEELDSQRDLAKEAIKSMEDLYLRFEKEKSYIQLKLQRDYDLKLQKEKEKFDAKLKIYKKVNGIPYQEEEIDVHDTDVVNDSNSSIELAKVSVMVSQT